MGMGLQFGPILKGKHEDKLWHLGVPQFWTNPIYAEDRLPFATVACFTFKTAGPCRNRKSHDSHDWAAPLQ